MRKNSSTSCSAAPFAATVTVANLSWRRGKTTVLRHINLHVEAGQMVAILGPNGVGKTTLLRCLYRHFSPTEGAIYYGQQALATLPRRQLAQHLAVVLQHQPMAFSLTVEELLSSGLLAHKRWWQWPDKHADDTAMTDVLTQVGLVHCRNQMVAHLSGGEQQRLFIARALLQRPQVLLLDEPTNHLDVRYQIEILQLLKQLGITVICTLHDLNLAAAYCDQVALMEHGTIAAFGSPQSVLTTERIQRIYGVTCRINHATEACPPYPRILFDYRATTPAVQGGAHA